MTTIATRTSGTATCGSGRFIRQIQKKNQSGRNSISTASSEALIARVTAELELPGANHHVHAQAVRPDQSTTKLARLTRWES